MAAFIFGLISASPAADGKKTRCAAASVARARREARAALSLCGWRGWKKKKSGDARERREEEGLTLTPSVFLFSRLLAAVEREQDDGDRENGEEKKKSVDDDWNQDTEARNAPFLRGEPVCEIDGGPGGLNTHTLPD